jgi:hypothetical protein
MFPVQAFVGMISDEIDLLRKAGRTDEQIAYLVRQNSAIQITPRETWVPAQPTARRSTPPRAAGHTTKNSS